MKTHTFQLQVFFVEPETCIGIEADGANPEWGSHFVGQAAARVLHLCHKPVHHRRIAAPKLRVVYL